MVDGVGDILDPFGLSGSRLEVQSLIIDAFAPHIKTLIRAVELSGGDISGLVLRPAHRGARGALQTPERSRHRDRRSRFRHDRACGLRRESLGRRRKIPCRRGNISNDLAVGLKIPVDAAEEVKIHYGYAYSKEVAQKESVDLKKFAEDARAPSRADSSRRSWSRALRKFLIS